MPSLDAFNDFVKDTGQKLVTGPDQILNDATSRTYFIARMLKGRDVAEVVQSGSKLVDRIQLAHSGTATTTLPNEDLDIQNVDVQTSIEVNWRFLVDHYSYTKQEVTLNSGDPQTYYKNLLKSKRQACKTSTMEKAEELLWAEPSNADMESAGGRDPYSLAALVTADGLAPSGFTTVETVNPTNESNWRNQVETYDPANINDSDDGLLNAMDRMWHKERFISPRGGMAEYFENDRLQKMVIASNLDGITVYQRSTRDANDRAVPANNLGWMAGNVNYAGIPVEYVDALNTAGVNAGSAMTAGEPWFYYLNLEYLVPIFHSQVYMQEEPPLRNPKQPFSYVVWTSTWYNLFMRSRRRQGLVVPNNV